MAAMGARAGVAREGVGAGRAQMLALGMQAGRHPSRVGDCRRAEPEGIGHAGRRVLLRIGVSGDGGRDDSTESEERDEAHGSSLTETTGVVV